MPVGIGGGGEGLGLARTKKVKRKKQKRSDREGVTTRYFTKWKDEPALSTSSFPLQTNYNRSISVVCPPVASPLLIPPTVQPCDLRPFSGSGEPRQNRSSASFDLFAGLGSRGKPGTKTESRARERRKKADRRKIGECNVLWAQPLGHGPLSAKSLFRSRARAPPPPIYHRSRNEN